MNVGGIVAAVFGLVIFIGVTMWGMPQYSVWEQGLAGEAELARAEQNRQIKVNEALAYKQAAIHMAAAEIIRAGGVAEANKIIADGLGGPQGYLRWRFITMLEETGGAGRETIYIPTEAGMPILEAGRLAQ